MAEWISVKDRLPESNQDVLICFDLDYMAVGFFKECDTGNYWYAYTGGEWVTDCDSEPLYWMPLPSPPEGE